MQINDIPKEQMEKLVAAIADLRPEMRIRIIAEDIALYQLGLTPSVPCSIEIDATSEEIEDLLKEVQEMEIDAWNFDDRDLENPEIAKIQKELQDRYSKYEIIEAYL